MESQNGNIINADKFLTILIRKADEYRKNAEQNKKTIHDNPIIKTENNDSPLNYGLIVSGLMAFIYFLIRRRKISGT